MNTIAIVMGANPLTAEKDMEEVRQFELKLANISTLSGNSNIPYYLIILLVLLNTYIFVDILITY